MDLIGITSDLGLNLVAEAAGIVTTVFWIDHRIKKREAEREKARWLPATNIVYAMLYQALDDYLGLVLGYNYTKNRKFLIFGHASSSARVDLCALSLEEPYFALEKAFKDKIEMKQLFEKYGDDAVDCNCTFDRTPYVQLKDELFKNLNMASDSIEPEMRGHLLNLDAALATSLSAIGEHITDSTHIFANIAIRQAVETMKKLKSKATKEVTHEEYFGLTKPNCNAAMA